MADKKSNEEMRQEVLKEDSTRDVNFNLAVFVAAFAIASSAAAALAVLAILFLNTFRADVDNLWMCCIPLCFSFVTGVGVAYRKQMADVGVHIALAVTTLLAGGAGYGLSVEPVYFNRHNCTLPADYHGECDKEVLTSIYFIAGAVASGFAVLGFLASLCACSNAMNRRARREKFKLMRLEYEENRRKGDIRDQKRRMIQPALSPTSNGSFQKPAIPPRMNGVNGTNGTTRGPLQIINEQPEIIREEPEVTTLPEPPKDEPEIVQVEPNVTETQQEVKIEEIESRKDQPEVTKTVQEINTTTIIVRDFQHDRKKQAAGVDRGTQVEPLDTIIVPAKRDVGVSPYEEESEAIPQDNREVRVAPSEEKVPNADGDNKTKVMTHL